MPRKKRGSQINQLGWVDSQADEEEKPLSMDYLIDIEPLTDNQKILFKSYKDGKNIIAYGCAGTGKTFITLYNAIQDVLNENTPYERIYLVRSLVSTREIGFYPVIMKIRQTYIKYLINTWLNICFRCQLMLILKCYMVI